MIENSDLKIQKRKTIQNSKIKKPNSKNHFQNHILLNLKKIKTEITKLIIAEIKNGTEDPK